MSSSATRPDADSGVLSVSELVGGLRELLADRLGRLWVAGEISNCRRAASGHSYFTLKDDSAQIRAVLFRGVARGLAFDPEDGLEVLVNGEVTVYEARGDLQILVRALEPRGQGALQLAVEQLRARLESQGLFDPALRRPLPELPNRVAVVTSAQGAALQDVLEVSAQRFPGIPLLVSPTRVQGEGAEDEIAAALHRAAHAPGVDVVLLVRGGGSLEDLMCFNTEVLVRAIRESPVPVVTGVGHEVDVTLVDLAADERAPTPSAAAARVLPDRDELRRHAGRLALALRLGIGTRIRELRARGEAAHGALLAVSPAARLATQRAVLEAAWRMLQRGWQSRLEERWGRLRLAAGRLDGFSPLAVLGRGYAIVHRLEDDAIVRSPEQVRAGAGIRIRLAEGELRAIVGPASQR